MRRYWFYVRNDFYDGVCFYKKIKIQFSRQNIRDTEKILENKTVYIKKIFNFGGDHFFLEVISFVY